MLVAMGSPSENVSPSLGFRAFTACLALCLPLVGPGATVVAQTAVDESWFGPTPPAEDESEPADLDDDVRLDWSVRGGGGFFSFRNTLFRDNLGDPPPNPTDQWFEGFLKGRVEFERDTTTGQLFGAASYAVAANGPHTADLVGGEASSNHVDALYLGWRRGEPETGTLEVRAGRTPFVLAHQFLLADGFADGGSRGGYWSNARTAWAPGAVGRYRRGPWRAQGFWLRRDEQPETDTDTRIGGLDLAWSPGNGSLEVGATWLSLGANERASQRDGATVWGLRAYWTPTSVPLVLESEWVRQDNGLALDASAAYLQAGWTFQESAWGWNVEYRYAWFEGDDPATRANENYDPLYPGFRDWGTWWQGEIAGEYFLSNSNLRTHMAKLRFEPLPRFTTGWVWFDYTVDRPGSFLGGTVSDDLGSELDWYLDFKANDFVSMSLVLARTDPGPAAAEAFNRRSDLTLAFFYLSFQYF